MRPWRTVSNCELSSCVSLFCEVFSRQSPWEVKWGKHVGTRALIHCVTEQDKHPASCSWGWVFYAPRSRFPTKCLSAAKAVKLGREAKGGGKARRCESRGRKPGREGRRSQVMIGGQRMDPGGLVTHQGVDQEWLSSSQWHYAGVKARSELDPVCACVSTAASSLAQASARDEFGPLSTGQTKGPSRYHRLCTAKEKLPGSLDAYRP